MKNIITNLNKIFDSRIRLGVMSLLMVEEQVDFNTLKETLGLTDGNLASHLAALEKAEYIAVTKSFVGKKPHTSYAATPAGRKAFTGHLDALELLIKSKSQK